MKNKILEAMLCVCNYMMKFFETTQHAIFCFSSVSTMFSRTCSHWYSAASKKTIRKKKKICAGISSGIYYLLYVSRYISLSFLYSSKFKLNKTTFYKEKNNNLFKKILRAKRNIHTTSKCSSGVFFSLAFLAKEY